MKKIYAILVAALMTVSIFAAPTKADLQSYVEDGYYVACFQALVGSTCNDIYWMGTYVDWNISTDLEDLVKCEELTGANAGWYVAKVPVVEGKANDGKPIQLNECGKLTWDVQPGTTVETKLVEGSVTIKANGDEYDLQGWSTDPSIITIGAWKKDYNPCERECAQQSYTIRVYPPYCEELDNLEPTIMGSFNNWTKAMTMTFKGSYFELITEPTLDNFEFKFNNDPKGSWDYEFQVYDAEKESWHGIPENGNLSLTKGTEYYTLDGTVLTFDFSDDEKYRYAKCGLTYFDVTINAILPAGAPAAGVELMGNFVNGVWDGEGLLMEKDADTGAYKATIKATEADEFKFRELGNWDNQIEVSEDGGETWAVAGNFKVGEEMEQDGDKAVLNHDLSEPPEYKWQISSSEGIENVVLTETAHKVDVDGVIYIVRDNKMLNIHGSQVR